MATPKKRTSQSSRRKTTATVPGCSCCEGEAYGVMFACEDGVHRPVAPPQGVGPWVLFWKTDVNGNWPYWEALANILPAPAPQPVGKKRK